MSNREFRPFTQVDLLRHGACQGGDIFRGSTDVELSDEGWEQMQQSVSGESWDVVITSPLKRCQQFATRLAKDQEIPLFIDRRWREFHFGDWEGRLRQEVWAESGDGVAQFFANPTSYTPPNGESYHQVHSRLSEAWNELIQKHQNLRVLVVHHGGTFRVMHAILQALPTTSFNSIEVPFACLSRWKVYQYTDENSDEDRHQAVLNFHNLQRTTPVF